MKVYLVWGIEYQLGRELYGVYDSSEKADLRCNKLQEDKMFYDKFEVEEITVNTDIE